jgi:hypothetical protein
VHGYRGNQLSNKSVPYGFGTAEFTVPVQHTEQHANRGKEGALTRPYRLYDNRTAAVIFWARFSKQNRTANNSGTGRTVRQSGHRKTRVLICVFFQSNSSTEFEEEIS